MYRYHLNIEPYRYMVIGYIFKLGAQIGYLYSDMPQADCGLPQADTVYILYIGRTICSRSYVANLDLFSQIIRFD